MWEYTGSNRGPSACKADALNQLSYTPKYFSNYESFWSADPPAALAFIKAAWRDALNQLSYTPVLKKGLQT